MKRVMDYINSAFDSLPDDKDAYKFRQSLVDSVTERANELTLAGLDDEKVAEDIIMSEHPDIKGEYAALIKEKKTKKKKKNAAVLKTVCSVAYVIAILIAFFALSFSTGRWGKTWVLPVDGILLLAIFLLAQLIDVMHKKRGFFLPASRVILALSCFIFATGLFLVLRIDLRYTMSWLVFIGGVIFAMIADLIYAAATRQKFTLIFALLYMPFIGAMLYIILSALEILKWSRGWTIILAFVLIDAVIIIARLLSKSGYDSEEDAEWNEN